VSDYNEALYTEIYVSLWPHLLKSPLISDTTLFLTISLFTFATADIFFIEVTYVPVATKVMFPQMVNMVTEFKTFLLRYGYSTWPKLWVLQSFPTLFCSFPAKADWRLTLFWPTLFCLYNCKCRGLLLHLITHTDRHTHTHSVGLPRTRDRHFREASTYTSHKRHKRLTYKVVKIWSGQTVTCLHTNSPGHVWTTLYMPPVEFEPLIPKIEQPQS
jgi:hypothetical protein